MRSANSSAVQPSQKFVKRKPQEAQRRYHTAMPDGAKRMTGESSQFLWKSTAPNGGASPPQILHTTMSLASAVRSGMRPFGNGCKGLSVTRRGEIGAEW